MTESRFGQIHEAMADNPADLLRENGVQVTAQRLAVLRAVSDQPHGTANDIAGVARAEISVISRQAVYDALEILADKGLIRRIQSAGSPARYEDRVGDNHHHLICRTCGRMVDADCAVSATPCLTAAADSGYEIDETEVVYSGCCPDCLAEPRVPAGAEVEPSRGPYVLRESDGRDTSRLARRAQNNQTSKLNIRRTK